MKRVWGGQKPAPRAVVRADAIGVGRPPGGSAPLSAAAQLRLRGVVERGAEVIFIVRGRLTPVTGCLPRLGIDAEGREHRLVHRAAGGEHSSGDLADKVVVLLPGSELDGAGTEPKREIVGLLLATTMAQKATKRSRLTGSTGTAAPVRKGAFMRRTATGCRPRR